jgi:hypothetical protein
VKVTAEDIAQLLASAPPRAVPPRVAKAVLGGRGAWVLPLFGLVFGGMGLLFTFLFCPWRFQDDWRLAADGARTAPGVITEVIRTSLSINESRVMEYGFDYTAEDGRHRRGRCFTTGEFWSNGAAVTVRYLSAEPDLACVAGARLSRGGGGAFVLIFPLIGGGLLYWFLADRRSKRRLLRTGLVAEVDVVAVENTNARVNEQPVYKITVGSPAGTGGQPVMVRRFNPPDVNLALKHFQDKQPVFVLYDPAKPKRLLFPEALIDGGA